MSILSYYLYKFFKDEAAHKMQDRIHSVAILYHLDEGGEYRLLADYFRLMGIFVLEQEIETIYQIESKDSFDLQIHIKVPDDQEHPVHENIIELSPFTYWDLPEIESEEAAHTDFKESIKKEQPPENLNIAKYGWLRNLIAFIRSNDSNIKIGPDDLAAMEIVSEIYCKYNLSKHLMEFNYLFQIPSIVKIFYKYICNAYNELGSQLKKNSEKITSSPYLRMFRMDLARYINEADPILNYRLTFSTEMCLKELNDILSKDPKMKNACMLKGNFREADISMEAQCFMEYEQVWADLKEDEIPGYFSYCYYRVGRAYEKYLGKREEAIQYYETVLQKNPKEYRAIFKLAKRMEAEQRNGDEAAIESIEKYEQIWGLLEHKLRKNCLRPKEYIYLYKSANEKKILCHKLKRLSDEERAETQKQQVLERLDLEQYPNHIMEKVYGKDAIPYANIMKIMLPRTQCRSW